MSLTPATVRQDRFIGNKKLNCGPGSKPCGGACIPKGNKCRASWNKPVKAAAAVAGATTLGLVATGLFHKRAPMRQAAWGTMEPAMQAGFAMGNIARGNPGGAAKNVANVFMSSQNLGPNLRTLKEGYGQDLRWLHGKAKEAAFKAKHHRPAKKRRDSDFWADGFGMRDDAVAGGRPGKKCGGSAIAANKKCTKGAGGYDPTPHTRQQQRTIIRGLQKRSQSELKAYGHQIFNEIEADVAKKYKGKGRAPSLSEWSDDFEKHPKWREVEYASQASMNKQRNRSLRRTAARAGVVAAGLGGMAYLARRTR